MSWKTLNNQDIESMCQDNMDKITSVVSKKYNLNGVSVNLPFWEPVKNVVEVEYEKTVKINEPKVGSITPYSEFKEHFKAFVEKSEFTYDNTNKVVVDHDFTKPESAVVNMKKHEVKPIDAKTSLETKIEIDATKVVDQKVKSHKPTEIKPSSDFKPQKVKIDNDFTNAEYIVSGAPKIKTPKVDADTKKIDTDKYTDFKKYE